MAALALESGDSGVDLAETPACEHRRIRCENTGHSGVLTPETPVWQKVLGAVECDNSQYTRSETTRRLAGYFWRQHLDRILRLVQDGVSGAAGYSGVYPPDTPG